MKPQFYLTLHTAKVRQLAQDLYGEPVEEEIPDLLRKEITKLLSSTSVRPSTHPIDECSQTKPPESVVHNVSMRLKDK